MLGLYQTRTYGLFGFGVDAVPAQDAWALGLPGFQGMNLEPGNGPGQNYDSMHHPGAEDYYFHFPDGNASIARLLVRRLVPAAVPGTTADDVVTARVDYAKLDDAGVAGADSPQQHGAARGARRRPRRRPSGVTVKYLRGDTIYSVQAAPPACWPAGTT